MFNNSAGDRSISLKLGTVFDHVTHVPQTFKVNGSRVNMLQLNITYQQQKLYKSGTDRLTEFKHDENYLRVQRNTWQMFKVTRSNTEIAITLMRIARFRLNMVGLQSFITAQPGYYEFSRSKGQRSRSQRNLSLIHIWRCRRIERCRSRWSPYH